MPCVVLLWVVSMVLFTLLNYELWTELVHFKICELNFELNSCRKWTFPTLCVCVYIYIYIYIYISKWIYLAWRILSERRIKKTDQFKRDAKGKHIPSTFWSFNKTIKMSDLKVSCSVSGGVYYYWGCYERSWECRRNIAELNFPFSRMKNIS